MPALCFYIHLSISTVVGLAHAWDVMRLVCVFIAEHNLTGDGRKNPLRHRHERTLQPGIPWEMSYRSPPGDET